MLAGHGLFHSGQEVFAGFPALLVVGKAQCFLGRSFAGLVAGMDVRAAGNEEARDAASCLVERLFAKY
jgi:hypothetical protein